MKGFEAIGEEQSATESATWTVAVELKRVVWTQLLLKFERKVIDRRQSTAEDWQSYDQQQQQLPLKTRKSDEC